MKKQALTPSKTKKQLSLMFCILAAFFAVIIPIICLQVYNYIWNSREVETELISSASSNTAYLSESFQSALDGLVYAQAQLLSDADVSRFYVYSRTASAVERYEISAHILNALKRISYSSKLVRSVELYYPDTGTLFRVAYADRSSVEEPSRYFERISAEEAARFAIGEDTGIFSLRPEGDTLLLNYYGRFSGTLWCVSRITLEPMEIAKFLHGYDDSHGRKAFLIHDAAGLITAASPADRGAGERLAAQLPQHTQKTDSFRVTAGAEYIAFCSRLNTYPLSIVQFVNEATLNAIPRRLQFLLVLATCMILVGLLFFVVFVHYIINRPVRRLVQSFQKAGGGELNVRTEPGVSKELGYISNAFNSMMERLERLIDENYQKTILLQAAKLHQFQSQVKPHFLYNSFFMLRHAVQNEELDKAEQLCTYLGNYFRFIAKLDREQLLLADELQNTEGYIAIQEMRFSGCLTIEKGELPEDAATLRVPALILQPLIENAIEHGMTREHNIVRISFCEDAQRLFIRVEDSGAGLTDEQLSAMNAALRSDQLGVHATVNISNRLRLFYGEEGGLRFRRSELGGCMAEVRIPRSHAKLKGAEANGI